MKRRDKRILEDYEKKRVKAEQDSLIIMGYACMGPGITSMSFDPPLLSPQIMIVYPVDFRYLSVSGPNEGDKIFHFTLDAENSTASHKTFTRDL